MKSGKSDTTSAYEVARSSALSGLFSRMEAAKTTGRNRIKMMFCTMPPLLRRARGAPMAAATFLCLSLSKAAAGVEVAVALHLSNFRLQTPSFLLV